MRGRQTGRKWGLLGLMLAGLALLAMLVAMPVAAAGDNAQPKRGIFGTVVSVDTTGATSTVSLDTKEGQVEVTVTDQTVIKVPARAEASVVDLTPGARLAILATQGEDSFEAISILVIPDKPVNYKQVVGTVEVAGGQLTIVAADGTKTVIELPPSGQKVSPGQIVAAVVKLGYKGQALSTLHLAQVVKPQNDPAKDRKILAIRAPEHVAPGEQVTFEVVDRAGKQPVADVSLYAIALPDDDSGKKLNGSLEDAAKTLGTLMGKTGAQGKLAYTFATDGDYLVVAVKADYIPTAERIDVRLKKALDIEAPGRTKIGDTVTIKVTDKETDAPVANAKVYAIPGDKVPATVNSEKNAPLNTVSMNAGNLIGTTNANGELTYAFNTSGAYVLVATLDGYRSAMEHIFVLPASALSIQAPAKVAPNTPVTFVVIDRMTRQAVEGASVYAFSGKPAESDIPSTTDQLSADLLTKFGGVLLGKTDLKGVVTHSFAREGGYLIVALKSGSLPGWSKLLVGKLSFLDIKVPGEVKAGEEATLTVVERDGGAPVGDAAVFAIGLGANAGSQEPAAIAIAVSKSDASVATMQTAANALGRFLGETENDGTLKFTIDRPGNFMIVALKQDYIPGKAQLKVSGQGPTALSINGPEKVDIGQQATFSVTDSSTNAPVQGAAVYAFPMSLRDVDISFTDEPSPEVVMKWQGVLLGKTDANGKVSYTFQKPGAGQVVAVKKGYAPGFTKLVVLPQMPKNLVVAAPAEVKLGEPVTVSVADQSGAPVAEASLFALPANIVTATAQFDEKGMKDLVGKLRGVSLGRTDSQGKLTYTPQAAGAYRIVAVKGGYLPGSTNVTVKAPGAAGNTTAATH